MSRVLVAPKGSASRNKSSTSPNYKLFVWDVGTDSKQPHEATMRSIAILEYSSKTSQTAHFSTAMRPRGVKTRQPTPTFCDVWSDIVDFIHEHDEGKPPLLISHNAAFDVTVLLAELRRNRVKVPSSWRFACSLLLARSIYHFTQHNSQLALASRLGINVERPHNTSEDVIVLRRILYALDDKAIENGDRINRVTPALCLHARTTLYFDRTPQVETQSNGNVQAKFFITTTGTRYHREGCKWLSRSKIPRNELPPDFTPCRTCRPDVGDNVVRKSRARSGVSRGTEKNAAYDSKSPSPSACSTTQFFVTNSGKRYHVDGCKWLIKSKIPIDSPPPEMRACQNCIIEKPRTAASPAGIYDTESFCTSPTKTQYYTTKTGNKYHVKGCSSLARSCTPTSERLGDYSPCGKCLPNIAYGGTPRIRMMEMI